MAKKQAKTLFNHKRRINRFQPITKKGLYPGMIGWFSYKKTGVKHIIRDDQPLVLVVWNDYQGYKIHGLNLNYLPEYTIKKIIDDILERGNKTTGADIDLAIAKQDDKDESYDKGIKPPFKPELTQPYTRLKLPTFKEEQGGRPISKAEATRQMKLLYEQVLKKYVKTIGGYRTYSYDNIINPRAVQYDIGGLIGEDKL
tara:strand:- start:37 stop:633 length:597 start_codon:yes stop_codon:yes gene_type:complete